MQCIQQLLQSLQEQQEGDKEEGEDQSEQFVGYWKQAQTICMCCRKTFTGTVQLSQRRKNEHLSFSLSADVVHGNADITRDTLPGEAQEYVFSMASGGRLRTGENLCSPAAGRSIQARFTLMTPKRLSLSRKSPTNCSQQVQHTYGWKRRRKEL